MNLEEAKRWLKKHLATINHNGIWGVPRTATTYRIDHKKHEMVRLEGAGDESTEYVANAIGWTVRAEQRITDNNVGTGRTQPGR